jgi:uncharacterized SAM-binding protein YcdF (DUF218 family)
MDKYDYLEDLWKYLYREDALQPADVIIGFGSHDVTTASRAARLYKEGWAPWILFTGYLGKGTLGVFPKPEAELFAEIAVGEGVPPEAILIENKATNTGENIRFARELLEGRGIAAKKIIAVHKPYMTRRVWAAMGKQWPEAKVIVAPGNPSMRDYVAGMLRDGLEEAEIINSLVGDFQRMEVFARMGYQVEQEIPAEVWESYEKLVGMGYSRYVV